MIARCIIAGALVNVAIDAIADGGIPAPTASTGGLGVSAPPLTEPALHFDFGATAGPIAERYELVPRADGSYEYSNPRFTAWVARDGRVSFRDRRVTVDSLRIGPFDFARRSPTRPREDPLVPWQRPPSPISIAQDHLSKGIGHALIIVDVRGRFDVNEEYLRLVERRSPHRTEQARFLAATSEVRAQLAALDRARNARIALGRLQDDLEQIWRTPGRTTHERRQIIAHLWAEVDASTAGGAKAAQVIEAWVRRRLPAGSPDAYTIDELAEVNRTRSTGQAFSPYETPK